MMDYYQLSAWILATITVLAFAAYSVIVTCNNRQSGRESNVACSSDNGELLPTMTSIEKYFTASNSCSLWQIAWSFYATAVGAWLIVTPPNYAALTGVIGLIMYPLACSVPLLMLATMGKTIRDKFPNCNSFSDYCKRRFGKLTCGLVVVQSFFSMSIGLCAEYTTIGSLFKDFVGTVEWPFILLIAVLTLAYTAYGGLRISILTDKIQAIFSVILILILTVYVAVTFDFDLPELPPSLGATYLGYSSILTAPASLLGAFIFSEALWQRVWASQDSKTALQGASLGCIMVMIAVFLTGFAGFLAAWAGLITEDTNPNLYMFQVFAAESGSPHVSSWVGVVVMMLAVALNESSIDSFQNAIIASISCHFFKDTRLRWIRVAMVLVNVPYIIIALQQFSVLQLFLIANMVNNLTFPPLVAGFYTGPGGKYMSDGMTPFCFLTSFTATSAFGISQTWDPSRIRQSIGEGMKLAWYSNNYDARFFGIAIGTSISCIFLWVVMRFVCECFLGIWEVKELELGCEHDSTVSMGVDSKVYTIMSKRLLNLARNGLRFSKSTESRSVVLVKEDKSQTVTALASVTEVCTIEESGISKSFAEVGSSIPADAAEVEVMVRSCSDNKNVLQ